MDHTLAMTSQAECPTGRVSDPPLLGILMLQTRFPRFVGDVGNPDTWAFPVLYQTVPDATVDAVVQTAPDVVWADRCRDAAQDRAQRGVSLITTRCGFLGPLHLRIGAGLPVPFVSTALMQIPLLRQLYGPARPMGVLTFDDAALSRTHLTTVCEKFVLAAVGNGFND